MRSSSSIPRFRICERPLDRPQGLEGLPDNVARGLTDFISSAVAAFGSDLKSAVLYGSGAEGRLRAASDVNLLLVLSSFDAAKADAILTAMFLLESELESAMTAFGQKFSDMVRRHRLLYGRDPFEGVHIPRTRLYFV